MDNIQKSCKNCNNNRVHLMGNPCCVCKELDNWQPDYQTIFSLHQQIVEELEREQAKVIEKERHIEALKEVLNEYVPIDKLDEANDKVILLTEGIAEEIGRALLNNFKLNGGK